MINPKGSIVILTGAGISAESGLKTFRGSDGMWENHPVEEVASIDGFLRNPELVQQFYNQRRSQLTEVVPNEAHRALVVLEREWPGEFLLVTQNVDDLHERAGSEKLIHMHGELAKVRCQETGEVFEWRQDILPDTECPSCARPKCVRPHIVWFGEMPLEMDRIYSALETCDLFISIGTSGLVYPAAGFVQTAKNNGRANCIELNMEFTAISPYFDEHKTGRAGDIVPETVKKILAGVRQ